MKIRYSEGYKVPARGLYACVTPVVGEMIEDTFFTLYPSGLLTIRKGFAWDGASGPTFDTKNSMRASLVHDVFCVCMRDGRLSYESGRTRSTNCSGSGASRTGCGPGGRTSGMRRSNSLMRGTRSRGGSSDSDGALMV